VTFQALRKVPVDSSLQPQSKFKQFPAPTGGWVSATNPVGGTPLQLYGPAAEKLECMFPTTTGLQLMAGSQQKARVATALPCESLWVYTAGTSQKLFGAANGSIYDISSPADANVAPAAAVTGRSANYYSTRNFATAGGNYLYAVNDSNADNPLLFDGTTWSAITAVSVPISITGVTVGHLSQVNVYKNRLFFVEFNTMNVWALPVASLGGAAIQISLAGVFQLGGAVLFTATWSIDAGNGLNDSLVIMSTQGECAVYQGTDPSDATKWSLVGLYALPKPMGKNAYRKEGAELLILTDRGEIPMSAAVRVDKDQLAGLAVSRNIEPDWVTDAAARRSLPWEIVSWPNKQREIISVPVSGDVAVTPPWCYIRNTTTGAWCKRTGWNTRCLAFYGEFVYFGTNTGEVIQMEITGADSGAIYYPVVVFNWDALDAPGYQKTVISMRARFRVNSNITYRLSVSTDYAVSLVTPPNVSAAIATPGVWDIGLWDVSLWDTGTVIAPFSTNWESINLTGDGIAVQMQLAMGNVTPPVGELLLMDVLYEYGELML
jgi:hypothetical protein